MLAVQNLSGKQQKQYHRVLETAGKMMLENGFYKLSISEITAHLHVSRSTIYDYFGSKEGLVMAVTDLVGSRLDHSLDEVIQDQNMEIKEKFVRLARNQAEDLEGNCYPFLHELKRHLPKLYRRYEAGRTKRERGGYKKLIDEGIEKGLFDPQVDPRFLLQLYLKMGQLTSDTDIQEHVGMSKSETQKAIVQVFLEGTRKK